mmetsp:Transcript_14026/g.30468  ORF Transcript_14026/g.30468 Transcript_14026/m.30468 type:complete len:243 (+) Transcript_14026:173-901(+)|eukprot:CAMPEP_0178485546 /NCGR_PEP_ID=MMETSP0696-20121128/8330_1 /TAXON_ID=265572 /ORGANISM="Extubocellulus spinifer, Strain CCMP396" /LENGTH=242 /DNA_ID=CAMNT_0020113147 /DNA_START=125 /DNA_END=853 /DNA_ORIENTATION=+
MKFSLIFLVVALLPFVAGMNHHNLRRDGDIDTTDDRKLKSKSKLGGSAGNRVEAAGGGGTGGSGKSKSGKRKSGSGGTNRATAPLCMFNTPPDCVKWPLDEAEVNRALGPGIPGYTLSDTVLNPDDGTIYRVYTPDDGTLLPPADVNRIPGTTGAYVPPTNPTVGTPSTGGNRIPGGFTARTGACGRNIPSIGAGLPETCAQGNDCVSGKCAVSAQVVNGVCVSDLPSGWSLLPSVVACANK